MKNCINFFFHRHTHVWSVSKCDQNNLNEFVHYVYLGPWESVEGDSRGQREEEDIWTSVRFSQHHWTQGPHPLSLSRCPSQDVLRQVSTTGKKSFESDRKREREGGGSDRCQLQVRNHLKVTEREKREKKMETEKGREKKKISGPPLNSVEMEIIFIQKVFWVKIPSIANNPGTWVW